MATAGPAPRDELLDLLAAVAAGDAERGDVANTLRDRGVDALDVLLAVVARAGRSTRAARLSLARPLTPHRSRASDAPPSEHRRPRVPFVLNGTLHDPEDIDRFQGQELHFTPSPNRNELIVIDDRDTMNTWWQADMLFSANAKQPAKTLEADPTHGGTVVHVDRGPISGGGNLGTLAVPPGTIPPPESIPGHFPPGDTQVAQFYEHPGANGDFIDLDPNRGYHDLTEIGYGFLGLGGDWNDRISSFQCVNVGRAVLHEHVNWTGSTFFSSSEMDLHQWGWGDRASSLEAW